MPFLLFIISFLFALRGNYYTAPPSSPMDVSPSLCQANVETSQGMTVEIDSAKKALYADKESKGWILVKRNAPIPAWKVGYPQGEMELVGKVKSASEPNLVGSEVFIGVGHCPSGNPWPNIPNYPPGPCLDPLIQDVLFVVTKYGEKPPLPRWALPVWAEPKPNTESDESRPGFWWEFNVYVNGEKLPANPTDEDLSSGPFCWMNMICDRDLSRNDVMGNCRDWLALTECGKYPQRHPGPAPANCQVYGQQALGASVLAASPRPPSFIRKIDINFTDLLTRDKLEEIYFTYGTANAHPNRPIGTFSFQTTSWNVWYDERQDELYLGQSSPPYYLFISFSNLIRPEGVRSLQLGTFNPQRKFSYEWWTPACKPAIYLYPEKPTELIVKVKPQGKITESIPKHGEDGWQVVAYPDGRLREYESHETHETYEYLYYEAKLEKVKVPQEGWIVEKENLKSFFKEILPQLGLNEKEASDFLAYWLPKLEDYLSSNSQLTAASSRLFVGLIDREELDRVEPIEFSSPGTPPHRRAGSYQQPDTFIRVRFYFEKVADNHQETPLNGDLVNPADLLKDWLINLESSLPYIYRNVKSPNFEGVDRSGVEPDGRGLISQSSQPAEPTPISILTNLSAPVNEENIAISQYRNNKPRRGFTVVDWGGILANGSCGIGEKSE